MARYLTSVKRRAILRVSRRKTKMGGRAGKLQCNIPSHIIGERIAENADQLDRSPDPLEAQQVREHVRMGRVLQRQQSASLNRRRAAALALGAATVAVATRALPRSRAFPKLRVAKRPQRFPKVVGIPRTRTRPTTGVRRGIKGGAFRFPRFEDFPRRRRSTRKRDFHTGPRSGESTTFTQEEGF